MKKFIISAVTIFLVLTLCASCNILEKDSTTDNELSEYKMFEMMQGFWVLAGHKGEVSEKIKQGGIALSIYNSNMDIYTDFVVKNEKVELYLTDGNILEYYTAGDKHTAEIFFETKDGYELMVFDGDEGYMQFEKCSEQLFYMYKDFAEGALGSYEYSTYLEDVLSDKELTWYIEDAYWNEWYYLYADGTYSDMNPYSMVLYSSDMSGVMNYVDETIYITWEIYDEKLYITYESGDTYYFPIDYEYDSATGYAYLYLYDTEEGYEGCAWVLWDYVE